MSNFEQYFSANVLSDYLTQNSFGMKRFRTYSIFRFLTSGTPLEKELPLYLGEHASEQIIHSDEIWTVLSDYLNEDFYFSPSIRENSFDAMLLYHSILLAKEANEQNFEFLDHLILLRRPKLNLMDYSDINAPLPIEEGDETAFFAALSYLSCHAPAVFLKRLPEFEALYWEDLHFTCDDFVLYSFMDEYFETENCRSNPKFKELVDTLMTATLRAFDTSLEEMTGAEGLSQLRRPHSKFAGLLRFGAMDFTELPNPETACRIMKQLLEYAVTYELRNNLFDFHLDEDRIITLDNWKEKLKWYNTQYSNAYELAVSSFYASMLSRKLLYQELKQNRTVLALNH